MPKRATPTPPPVRRALATMGRHLSDWRRLQGLTAAQVADRAGVSLMTVRRLEDGSGATLENTLRVARALGILDQLIDAGDPTTTDVGRARVLDMVPQRASSRLRRPR